MKKLLLCLLAVWVVALAACVPQTVHQGGVVLRGAESLSTLSPENLSNYTDDPIVYVTKAGEKYHEAGCSHLSDSSFPVTLEQALQEGKEPCSRCHVVLSGTEPGTTLSPENLSDDSDESIVYVTKSGKKYHKAGCSYLSDSSIPITLEQALQEGKEPCSRCHKDIDP